MALNHYSSVKAQSSFPRKKKQVQIDINICMPLNGLRFPEASSEVRGNSAVLTQEGRRGEEAPPVPGVKSMTHVDQTPAIRLGNRRTLAQTGRQPAVQSGLPLQFNMGTTVPTSLGCFED